MGDVGQEQESAQSVPVAGPEPTSLPVGPQTDSDSHKDEKCDVEVANTTLDTSIDISAATIASPPVDDQNDSNAPASNLSVVTDRDSDCTSPLANCPIRKSVEDLPETRPSPSMVTSRNVQVKEPQSFRSVDPNLMDGLDIVSLRRWIECIGVVTFDLEIGQTMELCYPDNPLAADEMVNICFSAMPDSNSSYIGDMTFYFRTKRATAVDDRTPDRFLYGYVHFRQHRDETISRGFFQKSVILLSPHPFIGLFRRAVSEIAPLYYDQGPSAIQSACFDIARWQEPVPGNVLDVELCGKTLNTSIPLFTRVESLAATGANPKVTAISFPKGPPPKTRTSWGPLGGKKVVGRSNSGKRLIYLCEETGTMQTVSGPNSKVEVQAEAVSKVKVSTSSMKSDSVAALFEEQRMGRPGLYQDINVYTVFKPLLNKLWILWELVLMGQPVLVLSPTPSQCADAVLALVSLISPLPFFGDYRPYFTIHDTEFKEITSKGSSAKEERSILMGVTNPFFVKLCDHWPSLIAVGNAVVKSKRLPMGGKSPGGKGRGSITSEFQPGIWSDYIPLLKPDKHLLKQLLVAAKNSAEVDAINNEILRKHFIQLTQRFMQPFEKYFSVPPFARTNDPFCDIPDLEEFDADKLLDIVRQMPPEDRILENKSRSVDFYKRFMSSPNFDHWYRYRRQGTLTQTEEVYRQARFHCNVQQLAQSMTDIERISLLRRIQVTLEAESTSEPVDEAMVAKLAEQCRTVHQLLPEDFRAGISCT
eukprot:GFYU01007249.1.p1 GENE.GFYU01007249.1~~GFYU01007249.1.p1  ORF type:complete len:759 (+),score=92.09 GFYU01007249.1:60-2336(+)